MERSSSRRRKKEKEAQGLRSVVEAREGMRVKDQMNTMRKR